MSSKYDSFRSILDQLMGGDRDLLPDQKTNRQMHFSDDKVCKFFLCGLCPHELFTNTKSDLGPCTNLHDDDIKAQYDELPFEEKMTKYPYERDFIARMQKMVSDLDKRIDRGHQRLSLQDHENPLTPDKMEKMDAISEQIEMLLRQMEDLGAAGRLQEAQGLELQILKLKAEQEAIKKGGPGGSAVLSAQQQEKRLKVCEVCGAFLVVGDTDDRIKSHNDGKQHQGYYAIRTILEEKRKKMLEEGGSASRIIIRDDRDMSRGGRDRGDARGGRDSYSSSSRGRRDSRSGRDDYPDRDRDRDRSSSRDYRDYRDRDRDRDREGRDYREYRDRDRDRDRDSRRDRDREYRDRDRDGGSSRRRSEDEEAHGGARKREREREREPAAAAASPTESAANGAEDPDSAERKRRRAEE